MRKITRILTVIAVPLLVTSAVSAQENAGQRHRVGKIYVVGNDVTKDQVILGALGLSPGQPFRMADVRAAEENLKKLRIFDDSPNNSPSVTVIDNAEGSDYHDILVRMRESLTGSLTLWGGLNQRGNLVVRMTLEERNLDPHRLPTSWSDIVDRRAFRGAGGKVKVDLINISVRPMRLPMQPLINTVFARLLEAGMLDRE